LLQPRHIKSWDFPASNNLPFLKHLGGDSDSTDIRAEVIYRCRYRWYRWPIPETVYLVDDGSGRMDPPYCRPAMPPYAFANGTKNGNHKKNNCDCPTKHDVGETREAAHSLVAVGATKPCH
jgi:hypothetical protein